MTKEQDKELQDILQQSLELTEALRALEDQTEQNGGGLHILLSWAVEKATKMSSDLDEVLMEIDDSDDASADDLSSGDEEDTDDKD